MKKKSTLILSALLLSAGSLMAQSNSGTSDHKATVQRMLKKLKAVTPQNVMHKTTALHQRLIGRSQYNGSDTAPMDIVDSIAYHYQDTSFKSQFNFLGMEYSEYYDYPEFFTSKIEFDTMTSYADVTNPAVVFTKGYNTAGKITEQNDGYSMNTYTYSSQNLPEMREELYYNSGTSMWDTSGRTYYTHNSNGWLVKDSSLSNFGMWDLSDKSEYTYNTSGLPTSMNTYYWNGISWDDDYRMTLVYTGMNPQVMTGQYYDGTAWVNEFKDSLAYTSGQVIAHFSSEWDGSAWTVISEELRHLNSNNLPDSIFMRQYNGTSWDTMVNKVTYNSYSNPVSMATKYYVSDFPVDQSYFYYEEVGTVTGIPNAPQAKNLAVYPNPAKDLLYVTPGQFTGNKLQMNIVNSLGQVVINTSINNSQLIAVPVQQLQAGAYWLSIQDGKEVYRASFMKN